MSAAGPRRWLRALRWIAAGAAVSAVAAIAAAVYALRSLGLLFNEPVFERQPPVLPALERPAVLLFSKANRFVHREAIPAANAALRQIAEAAGWSAWQTDNAAVHNAENLARFRVVVWNNVTGEVLTAEQRRALREWLSAGGGWLGLHAAGDGSVPWPWYREHVIGVGYLGHTMSPQFQDAVVAPAADAPMLAHLPARWRVPQEEWYAFSANPRLRGSEVLLVLDEGSYQPKNTGLWGWLPDASMPGEHPVAWRHRVARGRAVYSAIGHRGETWRVPEYRQFLLGAMRWAGRLD